MIFDAVENLSWYSLKKPVRDALASLKTLKVSFDPAQRVDLTDGIFILPQRYRVKPMEERAIEAHQKYIDVHVMVDGVEGVGYAPRAQLASHGYDAAHDMERLTGEVAVVPFRAGQCAFMFPEDAHMTGIQIPGSSDVVTKLVVKIPISLWKSQK